jgi:drug/metabolite transporter (DMT)-like permease
MPFHHAPRAAGNPNMQLRRPRACLPHVASGTMVRTVAARGFDLRLILAVAAVWLLWGSTFAALRYSVATIPPFVLASGRFVVAGAVLYAICALRGRARPTRDDFVGAAVAGATLLLLGNGVVVWTVQFLPTGINSLLLSLSAVWMALIAFAWGGERPTRVAVAGMVLGFAGMVLLLQPKATAALPLWPAFLALLASISWAFGSVYQRRAPRSSDLLLATALQMLIGGALLALEATLFGEWRGFDVHAIAAASWGGFAWLVIFGSVFAFSAYLYTMQFAGAALASTYAYVNPMVAVILGMILFHERFTPLEALAGAIILIGVALMVLPSRSARTAAL